MKKFRGMCTLFVFLLTAVFVGHPLTVQAETSDPASQDAERNRELLEIWKDHVKTLTKERDDAYRELEKLRASGHTPAPAAVAHGQFGIESQPISPVQLQQMEGLRSTNRDLQMQFSALQNQYQQAKKEIVELKSDRTDTSKSVKAIPADRLQDMQQRISELQADNASLNRALAEAQNRGGDDSRRIRDLEGRIGQGSADTGAIDELQSENKTLRDEIAKLRIQQSKGYITSGSKEPGLDAAIREKDAFMRSARQLQYENDTLKAQIDRMKVIEKELQSTRSYFSPMVQDLQSKNEKLDAENDALRSAIQKYEGQTETTANYLEEARNENERLRSELEVMRKSEEETERQIESYKSRIQLADADKERIKELENGMEQLISERNSAQKAYAELQNNSRSQEAQLQQISSQLDVAQRGQEELKARETQLTTGMAALQKENQQLQSARNENSRQTEKYRTALRTNLTDMQNLKSNFEAYLESLVASFDERSK